MQWHFINWIVIALYFIGILFKSADSFSAWVGFCVSALLSLLLTNPLELMNLVILDYSASKLYAFTLPIIIIGSGVLCGWFCSLFRKPAVHNLSIGSLKDTSNIL